TGSAPSPEVAVTVLLPPLPRRQSAGYATPLASDVAPQPITAPSPAVTAKFTGTPDRGWPRTSVTRTRGTLVTMNERKPAWFTGEVAVNMGAAVRAWAVKLTVGPPAMRATSRLAPA